MTSTSTDRIEKQIVLKAPRSKVWRALTDSEQFGQWFGVRMQGAFTPGARVLGSFVDPKWSHVTMDVTVEQVEPERLFSYRWAPDEIEARVEPEKQLTTLVTFTLEDADGGTRLTVVESGFDRVPAGRREEAYRNNSQGWGIQVENIARFVDG